MTMPPKRAMIPLKAKAMPPKAMIPSKKTMPRKRAMIPLKAKAMPPKAMRPMMPSKPVKLIPSKGTMIPRNNAMPSREVTLEIMETKQKETTLENKNKTFIGQEPSASIEPTAFIHVTSETSNCMFPNSILFEQTELADCFLEYPRFDDQGRAPFHFETIRQYQADDQAALH